MTEVPRVLLVALRSEIRSWSGHWAQGFTSAGQSLVKHDKRMADGSCCTCELLEVLDAYLHPRMPRPELTVHINEPPPGGELP